MKQKIEIGTIVYKISNVSSVSLEASMIYQATFVDNNFFYSVRPAFNCHGDIEEKRFFNHSTDRYNVSFWLNKEEAFEHFQKLLSNLNKQEK